MAHHAASPFPVRTLVVVLTCTLAGAPTAAQARQGAFHAEYTVEVKDTAAHLFHVTATFSHLRQPRLDLALPVWTPGWYTIENYARNVLRFTVKDGSGERLAAPRSHASTWSIDTRGKDRVIAEFDYLATVLAVNQAKITSQYAFFTGTQLFLEPVGHRDAPATVRFVVPQGWRIATALHDTGDSTIYTAPDYDALVDAPTWLGDFDLYRFDVDGKPHFIVQKSVAPIPADTVARATARFAAMVRVQRAIFGSLPYEKYLVFNLPGTAESNARGALEHGNSYVGASGPLPIIPEPNAHEFFHLWNVKRIRPAEMWPYDYSRPNETPSLWVSEGITSYYDVLTRYRTGFIDDTTFLAGVGRAMGAIDPNDARRYFSPSDASISTWLGYDTPVAFSISYYTQGLVLGALLDLSIRHDTRGRRGLDDVMRALYTQFYRKGKGFTPTDLVQTVSAVAGRAYADFFRRHVTGVDVPPYDPIFAYGGFRLERSDRVLGEFGAQTTETTQGRLLWIVVDSLPAGQAGLRTGDVLLAADGAAIRELQFTDPAGHLVVGKAGQRVVFTVLRDGKQQQVPVSLGTQNDVSYQIQNDPLATPDQMVVRKSWLARSESGSAPR